MRTLYISGFPFVCLWLNAAAPTSPEPSRSRVAGSGTAVLSRSALVRDGREGGRVRIENEGAQGELRCWRRRTSVGEPVEGGEQLILRDRLPSDKSASQAHRRAARRGNVAGESVNVPETRTRSRPDRGPLTSPVRVKVPPASPGVLTVGPSVMLAPVVKSRKQSRSRTSDITGCSEACRRPDDHELDDPCRRAAPPAPS